MKDYSYNLFNENAFLHINGHHLCSKKELARWFQKYIERILRPGITGAKKRKRPVVLKCLGRLCNGKKFISTHHGQRLCIACRRLTDRQTPLRKQNTFNLREDLFK